MKSLIMKFRQKKFFFSSFSRFSRRQVLHNIEYWLHSVGMLTRLNEIFPLSFSSFFPFLFKTMIELLIVNFHFEFSVCVTFLRWLSSLVSSEWKWIKVEILIGQIFESKKTHPNAESHVDDWWILMRAAGWRGKMM